MAERLYRSREDRMLAGVAGGVAETLDADPSLVRIVWALLGHLHRWHRARSSTSSWPSSCPSARRWPTGARASGTPAAGRRTPRTGRRRRRPSRGWRPPVGPTAVVLGGQPRRAPCRPARATRRPRAGPGRRSSSDSSDPHRRRLPAPRIRAGFDWRVCVAGRADRRRRPVPHLRPSSATDAGSYGSRRGRRPVRWAGGHAARARRHRPGRARHRGGSRPALSGAPGLPLADPGSDTSTSTIGSMAAGEVRVSGGSSRPR